MDADVQGLRAPARAIKGDTTGIVHRQYHLPVLNLVTTIKRRDGYTAYPAG